MPTFKDFKRRGVETFLQAVGASETVTDAVYNEEYAKFQEMVDDLNEIGAGLSEYLISLKSNYGLGNDLACVLDSYYNGELARDWIQTNPGLSHLTLHNETQKFCAAWQENDEVVRKSVAHVWITRGLTPMRAFVNTVTPDIEEACMTRENMRKDADSYRRRYNLATKAMQSAATPEKKAEKQQEQAKLSMKLDRAQKAFEEQNAMVKQELEKAKIARDEAIEMMVVTVAACQMELFEQSYKRLIGATSSFPADKMQQVRQNVQNVIRAGGPNPSEISSRGSIIGAAVSQVGNVMTGKAMPGDYRQAAREQEEKEASALQQARQVAMADEQARAGGVVPGAAAKRASNGPPIPPKRGGGGPPALPSRGGAGGGGGAPAVPKWGAAKSAPPPVPSRGGGGAGPPAVPTKFGGGGAPKFGGGGGGPPKFGGGGGPPKFGGGGGGGPPPPPVRAGGGGGGGGPPAIPSRGAPAIPTRGGGGPPAIPTKKTGPPPPPRASAKKTATALYDNVPDDTDELAFAAGDKIEVLSKDASGWWEGQHVKSGKKGIFPANFVEE
ncbi:hypothetical protein TeGR_g12707 [Tetraparma gracilis]|uniref:SH3 domain-containing protein n=1 Tax=Tetraparma gracilis TaxID=2962635 RepID=A0ABQ6MC47_9STRA|nr:hypothetical protein TeGR_g12707 [Tetraparma gracilis]